VTQPSSFVPDRPIAEEVRRVTAELGLADRAADLDRNPEFPSSQFRALGERGLLGLRTPEIDGGRNLPLLDAAVGLYEFGRTSGTTFAKLSLQPEFCAVLGTLGTPAIRSEYLRALTGGRRLVGNHVTEPGAGSDAAALACRARRDADVYVLEGVKSEAAFAVDADAAIVYAQVEGAGVTAFLVSQSLEGVERTLAPPDLGERWMRRGRVAYHAVRVPATLRLGPEGSAFAALKEELTRERLLLAAIYLGVGRSSFEDIVAYAGERQTFGRPLRAHEGVAFPLAEDWGRLDAGWTYVERALQRLEAGADVTGEAALAKTMAVETALTAIDHAIQFHGGRGYSSALPHERRYRDVRSGRLAHGPDEVLWRVAGGRLWPRPSETPR
jgi:alkylation response protein AidB-like acyl-CoA dehydrogenase